MIELHIKKHLSHDALVGDYAARVSEILDHRRTNSNTYEVKDVMLSALACMYMQSSSLNSFPDIPAQLILPSTLRLSALRLIKLSATYLLKGLCLNLNNRHVIF